MHTIIAGNGIIGLSIAFRLAIESSSTDRITVVGISNRTGSATLAAGAMLNSFGEIELGSLKKEVDQSHFELSYLSTRMWPEFEREMIDAAGTKLPDECAKCQILEGGGCFDRGTYIVNNTSADSLDDENFEAIVESLKELYEPFDEINPQDIPNYEPEQRSRASRAIYIHNEGWLNPRIVLSKLDAIISNHPIVDVVDGQIERLIKSGSEVESVVLKDGKIIAGDKFVVATGASTSDIIDASNLGIEVMRTFYGVGTSLEIKSEKYPHTHCIRTPNRGLACGIYSVPVFRNPNSPVDHIMIGATNFLSRKPVYSMRLVNIEFLMRSAMQQINVNFSVADLIRINIGWRPTSQDTYPLIGKTGIDNLYVVSGTNRDGFHLSPVISKKIVSLLLGKKVKSFNKDVENSFRWFVPDRKPIYSLTREEAIEIGTKHLFSAAYQHDYNPSQGGTMDKQIKNMYREDLEKLHDKAGADDWGIHPQMLNMYRNGDVKKYD